MHTLKVVISLFMILLNYIKHKTKKLLAVHCITPVCTYLLQLTSTKRKRPSSTFHSTTSETQYAITAITSNKETLYLTTAMTVCGISVMFIILMCSCCFLIGFFCGTKYSNSKDLRKEDKAQCGEGKIEPVYEEVEPSNMRVVTRPNLAYEEVQL